MGLLPPVDLVAEYPLPLQLVGLLPPVDLVAEYPLPLQLVGLLPPETGDTGLLTLPIVLGESRYASSPSHRGVKTDAVAGALIVGEMGGPLPDARRASTQQGL